MIQNDGVIDAYLRKISKIPLLAPEAERLLAEKARKGDSHAKKKLIESNLRFVVKIAKAYRNQGLPLMDLIQEGNIGLIESIEKFDEKLGYRLTTYCGWWIRLAIQRAVETKARPVKVPINKYETLRKIKAFSSEFQRRTGRLPNPTEIGNGLNIPVKKVIDIQKAETSFFSLDSSLHEDLPPLSATLADDRQEQPHARIFRRQAADRLNQAMGVLNPREKKVLQWRFGLNGKGDEPASLRTIGRWIGLSAEGVRRIEEQALSKLRRPVIRKRIEGLV